MSKKEFVATAAEIVGKTVVSVIPVGGTLITEIYDAVKGNTLAKRQEKWQNALEERISELEVTLDDIGNNEVFTTALVRATELAMKTASEEKMQYLANAVVNSLNPNLDEEKAVIFLDILGRYTVSHIKIIYFFNKPTRFDGVSADYYSMGSPSSVLFQVHPELDNYLFDKVFNDVYSDGMVSTNQLNTSMTGHGMVSKRTTKLGDDFLSFILDKRQNIT